MTPGSFICFGIGVMICQPLDHQTPAPSPSAYCEIYKPIKWHKNDTRGTKEQVDARNTVWKRLCRPAPVS